MVNCPLPPLVLTIRHITKFDYIFVVEKFDYIKLSVKLEDFNSQLTSTIFQCLIYFNGAMNLLLSAVKIDLEESIKEASLNSFQKGLPGIEAT